jgi:hypothetical protein
MPSSASTSCSESTFADAGSGSPRNERNRAISLNAAHAARADEEHGHLQTASHRDRRASFSGHRQVCESCRRLRRSPGANQHLENTSKRAGYSFLFGTTFLWLARRRLC